MLILVIFRKEIIISNKKSIGQKYVALAHSEGCNVAKTSLSPIFNHFGPKFVKYEQKLHQIDLYHKDLKICTMSQKLKKPLGKHF